MSVKTFEFTTEVKLIGEQQQTDEHLSLIHKFADQSTTMDDFAIVEMTAVDDKPLVYGGQRIIVSKEYQAAFVEKYAGLPFLKNHRPETDAALGTVLKADLQEGDGVTSTRVTAFIAKGQGGADDDIHAIRKGRARRVSLSFRFSNYEEVTVNGVPHLKIMPSDQPTDGPREVSLVGLGAVAGGQVMSIAAADHPEDIDLHGILGEANLSAFDRECLLFGRMMKTTMVDDIIAFERQLGLIQDMKLAAQSYERTSPFSLQDRLQALKDLLAKKQQKDTQCSIDADALMKDAAAEWDDAYPKKPMPIAEILAGIRERI